MAFGITKYELTKLVLMVATLVAITVLSIWVNVRLSEITIEIARQTKIQADETEARSRWNQTVLDYTRGEQNGLKDRVEKVEKKVEAPPKVVVVISTPRVAPSRTPTQTPSPAPRSSSGGLGALFGGDDDDQ